MAEYAFAKELSQREPAMLHAGSLESRRKPWDAEDIEQMFALLFEGKSISQIAVVLDRTQADVRAKAVRLDMLPNVARRPFILGG